MRRALCSNRSTCPAPLSPTCKRIAMEYRNWTFSLRPPRLLPSELPAITGDCAELGAWAPKAIRPLQPSNTPGLWTTTLQLPLDKDVQFRYCICVFSADSTQTAIRSWESNVHPRTLTKTSTPSNTPDIYGEYNNNKKIDNGWLTTETVLQLKFHNNPFRLKSELMDGSFKVKLNPINLDNVLQPLKYIVAQVATINSKNYKFQEQEKFGREYSKNDFLLFNVLADDMNDIGFSIDFYKNQPSDLNPIHLGSGYILPNILKNSEGQIDLPVTCDSNPIGTMSVEYLIVRPMPKNPCNMAVSYANYWSERWTGLEVGHRGSGNSFKTAHPASIRENTIASLKKAAANGADMVEFDVQLSKDLVPVIFHDFHVAVALKRKNTEDFSNMLEIPMKDLTLEQLQKLKVYHVVEAKNNKPSFFDEDLPEHQPFPLLSELFKAIDPYVGFNIEIKSSMAKEDGEVDLKDSFDMNLYIDKILEVVLKFGGERKIVFSSFHPDICIMLKLKQNLYPTMFLTQGVTTRWSSARDSRCNTIPSAVYHALNSGLLGVVVHTEDLLRDPKQVKMVLDAGLIIFCWGDDNNNSDRIKELKKMGLHGVIFDKIDQYSTKDVKESIFLTEAKETQNQDE